MPGKNSTQREVLNNLWHMDDEELPPKESLEGLKARAQMTEVAPADRRVQQAAPPPRKRTAEEELNDLLASLRGPTATGTQRALARADGKRPELESPPREIQQMLEALRDPRSGATDAVQRTASGQDLSQALGRPMTEEEKAYQQKQAELRRMTGY